jgi:imidazoleglycerol-phosphate dehydratase
MSTSRRANVDRKTTETQIQLSVGLDGTGIRKIATRVPFFNHMLEAFAKHGLFDLEGAAAGNPRVVGVPSTKGTLTS